MNYKMEIYAVETTDGVEWNVEFPEVKGCGGAGKTKIEAILDAEENLKFHLQFLEEEGLPIPKAEDVDLSNKYSGKFTVRMSKSLHRTATELAQIDGVSLNAFVVEAISRYCGQQEKLTENNFKPIMLCDFQNGTTYLGGICSNVIRR